MLWAWKTGRLRRADTGDFAAVAAVVLGLRWFATGNGILALISFSGVALWAAYRSQQFRRAMMPVAEARELLGVSDDADQETIRAAHRRLIARVHPDAGGSAELARRVNAAREILLSEARNQVSGRRD
jgi:hypothetical protein